MTEDVKKDIGYIENQENSSNICNSASFIETKKTINENQVIDTNSLDSDDDDFESQDGLWSGKTKYDIPDNVDKFVDTKDGSVIAKENLTPFQMIKAIAKQNNHIIKEPKKGCNKCYGRGYEGVDAITQMPIPCRCLFRGKSENEKESDLMYDMKKNPGQITRLQRRRMAKVLYKQFKSQRKIIKRTQLNQAPKSESIITEQKDDYIKNILETYNEIKSYKKTAKKLNITLTEIKKIIKENS